MVIPGLVVVVDDSSAKAPRRVDTSPGDGDSGEMHHEHRKPNRQGRQHLQKNNEEQEE